MPFPWKIAAVGGGALLLLLAASGTSEAKPLPPPPPPPPPPPSGRPKRPPHPPANTIAFATVRPVCGPLDRQACSNGLLVHSDPDTRSPLIAVEGDTLHAFTGDVVAVVQKGIPDAGGINREWWLVQTPTMPTGQVGFVSAHGPNDPPGALNFVDVTPVTPGDLPIGAAPLNVPPGVASPPPDEFRGLPRGGPARMGAHGWYPYGSPARPAAQVQQVRRPVAQAPQAVRNFPFRPR